MSKNIVILSGSPRIAGNSEKLVTAFKEGAESSGNIVRIFRTAHMKINGCTGCEHCQQHKSECVLKDDMIEILDALREADVVVWASPVYYFSVTAQLKAAIDRMYSLISEKAKQTVLLLTCADESSDTAAGAFAMYERILKYYKWIDAGIIIATGVESINDIDGRDELKQARKLGMNIC